MAKVATKQEKQDVSEPLELPEVDGYCQRHINARLTNQGAKNARALLLALQKKGVVRDSATHKTVDSSPKALCWLIENLHRLEIRGL